MIHKAMICYVPLLTFLAVSLAPAAAQDALPGQGVDAGKTVVYRDSWGIPHIYAPTAEAGLYAMGWAQAEDHTEQLLRNLLMGMGELATVDGPGGVQTDTVSRMFEHYSMAKRRAADEIKPEIMAHLDAFTAGIAGYFEANPDKLPEWWGEREFDRYMVIAFARIFLYSWSIDDGFGDLRRGGIQPGFDRTSRSSNQFAIAPERSAEDAAILYIDPHLAWFGPSRFWEFRIHAGELKGSGFTLAGNPYIGLGHNANLAWAMTTGGPDTADIFELTLNPDNPMQYRFDDEWRDFTVRTEVIEVKGADAVEVPMYASHHGPIVAMRDGKAYAHAMAYHESVNGLEAWYHLNFGKDYEDVIRGLEGNEVFPQNVMTADTAGNIYYHRTGRVPIRPEGYDWDRPVPGDTSATAWQGIHPQSDLVHLLNPPEGYMQNCNIPPDAMLIDSPLRPENYPRYIFGTEGGNTNERGARAVELLAANDNVTAEEAIAYGLDIHPFGWQRWIEELRKAHEAHGRAHAEHPHYTAAVESLLAWDGALARDSSAALQYYYFRREVARTGDVGRDIGNEIDQHYRIVQSDVDFTEPELSGAQQRVLLRALADGMNTLVSHFESLDAVYGDKFRVGRDDKSWPLGGGGDYGTRTLRSVGYAGDRADHTRWGRSGQTSTQIVVMSDPVRSWTMHPIGQSDDPDSPHYTDQAEKLFSERKMKESWWLPQDLRPHIQSRTVLTNAPGS